MTTRSVVISSEEVELTIIRSSRRTIALYVRPGGTLLVRAPWYVPVYSLLHFVNEKAGWIIRQRKKLSGVRSEPVPMIIKDGCQVPYLGGKVTVAVDKAAKNKAELSGNTLYFLCKAVPSPERLSSVLNRWYLNEAKKYLPERTAELARIHAAVLPSPESVSTRKMKRRWGTCHSNGTIWLNRELIKKDPELIDYVIIHELCHLVHQNHGKHFYALLGRIIPDYRRLRQKLHEID